MTRRSHQRSLSRLSAVLALTAIAQIAGAAAPGERELELVLTRNPDLRNGEALYATCAACHGKKGEGISDGTVPAIAGQPYTVIAKQIVAFRAGLRGDERMAHFTDRRHLAFSQPIADVAGYVARLKPPKPSAAPADDRSAHGALTYARACERCHGPMAEGNDDTSTPRLASQHYEYLIKQFDDAAVGRRRPMADAHAGQPSALSSEELSAIARYLASLGE